MYNYSRWQEREEFIGLRVTKQERDLLKRWARQEELTLSEFIRRRLFRDPQWSPPGRNSQ